MAGEPLGIGEEAHPPEGNALLTTIGLGGQIVKTPLWMDQFSTDLNIQIDTGQLRTQLVFRPIRFTERFLTFNTIWNVADRDKYIALGKQLKEHWAVNLNENNPTPMTLKYFGASKTWKGYIENWGIAYAITDVVLKYQFRMRLLMTETQKYSEITNPKGAPFAPTAGDLSNYGPDWYSQQYWENYTNLLAHHQGSDKVVHYGDSKLAGITVGYTCPNPPETADDADNTTDPATPDPATPDPNTPPDKEDPKNPKYDSDVAWVQQNLPTVYQFLKGSPTALNKYGNSSPGVMAAFRNSIWNAASKNFLRVNGALDQLGLVVMGANQPVRIRDTMDTIYTHYTGNPPSTGH
jgi:hypothetical protein